MIGSPKVSKLTRDVVIQLNARDSLLQGGIHGFVYGVH